MDKSVLDRVLTIEEVKQRMKDIRTAAVHYGGVIHAGERGRDEIVIVSTKTWEELTSQSAGAVSAGAASDPYGPFARAMAEGRLGAAADESPGRRRMPNLQADSGLSSAEMVRIAGPEQNPRRRRPA
jgi:hypothetical protein